MILRGQNGKSTLSFTWRGNPKVITVPKQTIVDVDEEKKVVILRNMWSGAHEKWVANSEMTRIQLNDNQYKKLIENPHFKKLEKWKPCI
jgi:hypothetical protein